MTSTSSMEQRPLGRTGNTASVVGLGTWQLGADWGDVSETDAREVLETSWNSASRVTGTGVAAWLSPTQQCRAHSTPDESFMGNRILGREPSEFVVR